MNNIKTIKAREVLDSRGNPTIETTITLDNNIKGMATVPSGASVGKHEAVELRDHDLSRFDGKGVLEAVANVNNIIAPKLVNKNPQEQKVIDQFLIDLDGSNNKENLGANSILSVSLALACAAAESLSIPLYFYLHKIYGQPLPNAFNKMPTPTFNIINGGKHGADNLDFQEFHIIPATDKPYYQALQIGEEIYQKLKDILISYNNIYSVGDEGGFAPIFDSNMDPFDIIIETIEATPYVFGQDIFLGLDVAANYLLKRDGYHIRDNTAPLTSEDFVKFLVEFTNKYHLLMLEDPLAEDDWSGWAKLTNILGNGTMIIGDDLLVTNLSRLKTAIAKKAANSILIKPNQVGTLTETFDVIRLARESNYKIIISHRSGETNDTFIADLAVAVAADYVKFGAPARGERVDKYNRLLEIEEELKLK